MNLRKFVWVGKNRQQGNIWVSEPIDTTDVMKGNFHSFFSLHNRSQDGGNCDFLMEIFEGDMLMYHTKSSLSNMQVKLEDDVFVGEGPFNTLPLEDYFNSSDFISMEIEPKP